jgi:hypothetical protein
MNCYPGNGEFTYVTDELAGVCAVTAYVGRSYPSLYFPVLWYYSNAAR